ncbi:MAG TPA: STAS domain-containing protein [Acidobacteriota bacterium]|jgi:anti-anti-sigma factor
MKNNQLEQFKELVKQDPTDDLSWYGLGSQYLQVQRFAEAADAFHKVVELKPDHSAAYRHWGYALFRAGDFTAARSAFEAGIPVAEKKGDMQAAKEMEALLKKLSKQIKSVDSIIKEGVAIVSFLPGEKSFILKQAGIEYSRPQNLQFRESWENWKTVCGAIDGLISQGYLQFLIDLSFLPYIDSSGLGEVIRRHTRVRQRGGELKLLNPSERLQKLLRRTKLDTVLEVFQSEEEAIRSFKPSASKHPDTKSQDGI